MPKTSDSSEADDVAAAKPIRCILSDVDGVMTDGRIIYDSAGIETKEFHVRDGLGIKLWMRAGFEFGIITARTSPMVERRASELGIENLFQSSRDKLQTAATFLEQRDYDLSSVCYLGDDLPDLPVLRSVGLAVAPADAATDVRDAAAWILESAGGHGAVRETVERLLRAKGLWEPSKT